MTDPTLLVRHAQAWAQQKGRPLDTTVLGEVLELRERYDVLEDGDWPPGSAERLLLVTWPAYAPSLPDLDLLRDTLDTFWGFLRATGRMTRTSAAPAQLRKEAKRALPRMRAAYDDPAHHSQGRVLGDFARSIGVELDGAPDVEELQRRLDAVTQEWNALPVEERRRLMPDPSPKSVRGSAITDLANDVLPPPSEVFGSGQDTDMVSGGDLERAAQDARDSSFVRQCLALADWVGEGRAVTSARLLRPAVAREAYQHLHLWPWDRRHDDLVFGHYREMAGAERTLTTRAELEEHDRIRAETVLRSWRSAGDCLALDRLWYPCDLAGVVDIRSTKALRGLDRPVDDQEWRQLALALVAGLCGRLSAYRREPLTGILLMPLAQEGPVAMTELRQWWDSRLPDTLRESVTARDWGHRLELAMFHLEDCGLWRVEDETLVQTDLGRDFALSYVAMLEDGVLED